MSIPGGFTIVFRKRPTRDTLSTTSGWKVPLEAERVYPRTRTSFSDESFADPRGELMVASSGDYAQTLELLEQLRADESIGMAYVAPQREALSSRSIQAGGGSGSVGDWHAQVRLDDARLLDQWKRNAVVTVAVLDSGFDRAHPQLRGIEFVDYLRRPPASDDAIGHGTHVTGLIAASLDPGTGFVGVGNGCVKVTMHRGLGSPHDVAGYYRALRGIGESGARLVNLSVGGQEEDPEESDLIAAMMGAGAIVVAAAGNYGEMGSPAAFPAACEGVIAVASVERNGRRAESSNEGDYVMVAAPGVDIASTAPTYPVKGIKTFGTPPLATLSGTSMAAPTVTAIFARMLACNPDLGREQLVELLEKIMPGPRDPERGLGIVDACALLGAL
jgi:serine protease